ncbi:RNA polymerase sigma factor [Cohnella sp. REN36]|uniref:RNA polymerase sigma factor n=1 Tax=Cohnella sp. REN36 TaxID=2887347 RepID=UPI001D1334CE|nr:sigma-70 family RNA polymerase sigma factor [Cohnella sp. REN36]MCC3374359.1 sigma-70 family RNA polymerase sigma factor [Cohnella sp. REN36]
MSLLFLTILEDEDDKDFLMNLYQLYYPVMKQRAYTIIRNDAVVDDLIQDAFIKLIPKIPLLRSLNSYKTVSYIVNTMKHICLDYIRKESRRAQLTYAGSTEDIAEQIPEQQAATEESYIKNEEFETLGQALFLLSERDRNLLYFKYNMELSDKEIELLLAIPAQHVRQYIARARNRVFHILSEGGRRGDQEK